jgi:DNA-binding transcriptional ArsR family regulator
MEKVMMLSLDDDSSDLTSIINSKTAKRIISYLAEKEEATESDVAKDLALPISTVHYNLKKLLEAGVVISENYHYSDKGKVVEHYKIAERLILIVPSKKKKFSDFIKNLVPVFISFGVIALGLLIYNFFFSQMSHGVLQSMSRDTAYNAEALMMETMEAAPVAEEVAVSSGISFWQYMLIGALLEVVVITVIFAFLYFWNKRKSILNK